MFDLLRTRLAQRRSTSAFPGGEVTLPERFRGRPALSTTGESLAANPPGLATPMLRTDARQLPVLDVGACQFSPEEAFDAPGGQVRFTTDHRMASATRDGLVTPTGEVELAGALNERMLRLFGRSLRFRSVAAGSCSGCEAELVALSNVVFDMARFGIQFVASPRHADGILITGVVNRNMCDALERTYAAVGDPRLVIVVGACAISGGPFRGSSEVLGVPDGIPVDLWVPGCPPHPYTLLDGLLRLLGRVEQRRES
jgi:Ni,Fe-hydrogenase III small subunit